MHRSGHRVVEGPTSPVPDSVIDPDAWRVCEPTVPWTVISSPAFALADEISR